MPKTLTAEIARKLSGDCVAAGEVPAEYYDYGTQKWDLTSILLFRGENIIGEGGGNGRHSLGRGLYLTPDRAIAEQYANNIHGGRVNSYWITSEANIVNGEKLFELGFDDYVLQHPEKKPEDLIADYALNLGIDGISGFGTSAEFVLFNPKISRKLFIC